MLVLLIIFMVAAPLASVTIKVDAAAGGGQAGPATRPRSVYISIKKDGRVFVGDNAIGPGHAGRRPEDGGRRRADPAKERIFIRGDQDLLYEDFMAVMNKLQDNGFYSVALVGEDKSGLKK